MYAPFALLTTPLATPAQTPTTPTIPTTVPTIYAPGAPDADPDGAGGIGAGGIVGVACGVLFLGLGGALGYKYREAVRSCCERASESANDGYQNLGGGVTMGQIVG